MAINVDVGTEKSFTVDASPDKVFALLSDVPASVAHFPYVDKLEDLGNNTYQWNMEEISAAGFSHQVVYACEYHSDADAKTVIWKPVRGVGNAEMSGSWTIEADGSGSKVTFATTGTLKELPVPKLMKSMAKGLIATEFAKPIDKYHARLKSSLEST